MTEKVNMFDKAAEDRRAKFIVENDYVADEIMSTKPEIKVENNKAEDDNIDVSDDPSYGIKKILIKEKPIKRRCSYYLDSKVDDFFIRLAEIIGTSKAELVNEILIQYIAESKDLQELSKSNKKIKKILNEYFE